MATEKQREAYLRNTYGLSIRVYQDMVAFAKGGCHICNRQPKTGKHHNVDHDHKNMEIRGLLCFWCNRYLVGRRRREHAHLFKKTYEYLIGVNKWGLAITRKSKRRKARAK